MMDTTPCMGKGHDFIRLCCPTSYALPTCTWRGHRNTGKCKSGCKTFELEVGTLSAGCTKSGYQSACCTDTMVTSLYSKCVWTSCSKDPENACSGNNPHFLASSSVGSGGMSACKKGQKRSLCCVSPSPYDVSGKCEWRKKAGFLNDQELLCEGACSSDQLMLARESGLTVGNEGGDGCYGDLALCCTEPKKQEPRSEDPGSSEGREFQALIRKYMENPTCPATVLQPPRHDMFAGGRRSLDVESTEFDFLRGRAVDCALSNWVRLLQYATVIFTGGRSVMSPLTKVWDDEFAGYFDNELAYDSLSGFLARNTGYEPRSVLEWVLLTPTQAGPSLKSLKKATFALCRSPKVGPRSLSGNSSLEDRPALADRTIDAWRVKGEGDTPRLDTVLQAIMAGYLALHYARWQWYNSRSNGNVPGPMLELAYWIGDRPGVTPSNDMSEYQDLSYYPQRHASDQWVVFHLHIDHNDPNWLMRANGRTYVGIRRLTVYHGQYWQFEQRGQWRVAREDDELNGRNGFLCPRDTASSWYIGRDIEPLEGDPGEWTHLLNDWGTRLYDQGYVSRTGLRMIISPPDNAGGSSEIDPENPGRLVQVGEGTPAVGGNDPYDFNFLLEHDGINLTPDPPPQDRQHPNQG